MEDDKYCTIEIDEEGYYRVVLPDGTYLPKQVNTRITQELNQNWYSLVEVSIWVKIKKPETQTPNY